MWTSPFEPFHAATFSNARTALAAYDYADTLLRPRLRVWGLLHRGCVVTAEFFAKGDEHLERNEIGVLIGGGSTAHRRWPAFSWTVHPEEGVRRIAAAGGAQDAWGRDYTVAEFEGMLRGCATATFSDLP